MRQVIATKYLQVSNTAQELSDFGFSQTQIDRATELIISAVTDDVMIRWDGTAPTATVGHPIKADFWASLDVGELSDLQVIRKSTDADVTITLSY